MLNGAVVNSLASRWTDNTLVIGTHGNGMFATGPLGNPVTVVTSVFNPIRNNSNFIKNVYPTITRDVLKYEIGNMYSIKKMNIQVIALSGATVLRKDIPYQSGTIDMSNLPAGTYIVTITSNDRKYQSTKKIIKN
jgi:flagellar basal body rod protein FlgG